MTDRGQAVLNGTERGVRVEYVNLDGVHSYPIAERLASRGIPFLLMTGYSDWSLPPAYHATPRLGKPFSPAMIAKSLGDIIEQSRSF